MMRLYEVEYPDGARTWHAATTAGKAKYKAVIETDGAARFTDLRVRCLGPAAPPTPAPNYAAERRLPPGATCAQCFAVRFCVGIGCTSATATSCDYWPNRFRAAKAQESAA